LAKTGAQIVIISGNHDNPRRLTAIKPLLSLTNIYTVAIPSRPADGGLFKFQTKNNEKVNIALLPFLSQKGIVKADQLMHDDPGDYSQTYADRTYKLIQHLCQDMQDDSINLFAGHAMVHGGVLGGGERSAHTIFEYSIPSTAFPPHLHYVALGHLHRAQRIPGQCPIWYSGSPLPLDFSETDEEKSINLVEANPGVPATIETIAIKAGKQLKTLRGNLLELSTMAETQSDDLLRILIDADPTPGLADQVRDLFPQAIDVRILRKAEKKQVQEGQQKLLERSPQELFAKYLQAGGIYDEALVKLFNQLLEEIDEASTT
jgi:exonuclease SbcD